MGKIRDFIFKKNQSPRNNRKKVGVGLFLLTLGLFFLFVGRLIFVVATDSVAGVSLESKTKDLYTGESVIPATRGSILDRYGEALAKDATTYSCYVILDDSYIGVNNVKLYAESSDYPKLAKILADNLGVEENYALSQLEQKDSHGKKPYQVEFGKEGKNISLETKMKLEEAVKAADTKGLFFEEHPARLYPNGDFSSYLVGYAQLSDPKDESQGLKGIMGIEAAFNDLLEGKDGKIVYEKDHSGNAVAGTVEDKAVAENGDDIYTTLNSQLQSYLETLMDSVYEKSTPEDLTAVLMNAKTGEIEAMSQRPSFNPQQGFTEDTLYRNVLVEDPFEPGSTMKTMLLAAAINEGVFDPNETYNNKSLALYDAMIYDHDFGKIGPLNMSQAYSWSSNIGMVILEEKLGNEKWLQYLKDFGFGKSTESGLPNETAGSLPEDNKVSVAMSAFGQAVSVSALQMLQAYSAITNEGQMVKPYYISQIVNGSTGKAEKFGPTSLGQVVTKETAKSVLDHMEDVVYDENYGTGNQYAIEGYTVGAKTGTAQIAENGKYSDSGNDFIYSVMMAAPTENPEYLLYVTIKKPTTYSGKLLSELTNPLMKRALDMKKTEAAISEINTPQLVGQTVKGATKNLSALGLTPVVIGSGDKVLKQSVEENTQLLPNAKVLLLTDETPTMPDVTGWSKNDLMALENLIAKKFVIEGQGFAVAQSLSANSKITEEEIRVILQ